jgi:hypothetical protein
MSMHKLDTDMLELDHYHGKSDVYNKLYCLLTRLINNGNEAAGDAREEFEMAENYGHDSTEELLDILDDHGLKDAVLLHV